MFFEGTCISFLESFRFFMPLTTVVDYSWNSYFRNFFFFFYIISYSVCFFRYSV